MSDATMNTTDRSEIDRLVALLRTGRCGSHIMNKAADLIHSLAEADFEARIENSQRGGSITPPPKPDLKCAGWIAESVWHSMLNGFAGKALVSDHRHGNYLAPIFVATDRLTAEKICLTNATGDPALRGINDTIKESGGRWRPCTGCYDTEDGHPTQKYSFSPALQTDIGCGCHECGGLGAVWEHWTDEDVKAWEATAEAVDFEHKFILTSSAKSHGRAKPSAQRHAQKA